MGFRGSKHQQTVPINIQPNGGLNLSMSPSAIADNELTVLDNYIYSPVTGRLRIRPAFVHVTEPVDMDVEFTNLEWIDNTNSSLLVGYATNGKLYYVDGQKGSTWTELADVAGQTTFAIFNDKLIFADGSGLYSWDGDTAAITIETLTDVIKPDTVYALAGRLVINDTADLDAVWFSKPYDEFGWDTADEAVFIRVGYGDGMRVNALSAIGRDVIVSKRGVTNYQSAQTSKNIYRINTSGTVDSWSSSKLIEGTSADHPLMITGVHNDVLFVDHSAFKSITGVQQYGDLRLFDKGKRINTAISSRYFHHLKPRFVKHIPMANQVWISYGFDVFVYHIATDNFTSLTFGGMAITAVASNEVKQYLAADNGRLYMIDESKSMDEIQPGTFKSYQSTLRSKMLTFTGGEGILKRTEIQIESLSSGLGIIELIATGGVALPFGIVRLRDPKRYYGSASELYGQASEPYGSMGVEGWVEISRNRARTFAFMLQFRTVSGRCGIDSFNLIGALTTG